MLEISETEKGYLLKGRVPDTGECVGWSNGIETCYPSQKWELSIENDQLSFQKHPAFDENRLKLPLSFDKQQVESLKSEKALVDSNEEIPAREAMDDTIDMLSATLCNYWYDYRDKTKHLFANPGDFCRIYFTLPSGVFVGVRNEEGGWVKPSSQIKLPEQSTKVIKHEYGIILDIGGGNHILALTGYKYTQEPSFLTLICVTPDNADMVFNKKLELLEVQETEKGYHLLGQLPATQDEQAGRLCEIDIEEGELQFKEL